MKIHEDAEKSYIFAHHLFSLINFNLLPPFSHYGFNRVFNQVNSIPILAEETVTPGRLDSERAMFCF